MTVTVFVKPGSRKGPLVEPDPTTGRLTVYVPEPAVDGQATKAALKALARHFSVAPSRVSLKSGATARYKQVNIEE